MSYESLFPNKKPVIGCIHLLPLPGSPLYDGDVEQVYELAEREAEMLVRSGVDALIVENFRDKPFYPGRVPAETVAALASVGRDIIKRCGVPVGMNVLRNDGESAVAIATAIGADFVRINVHGGTVVSEQGVLHGQSHLTLRLRAALKSKALIFADVGVKHAAPLADRGLATEAIDAGERNLADALIVSGSMTGTETSVSDVDIVKANTRLPVVIGSGATPENVHKVWDKIDGLIVGSYFKKGGKAPNTVEPARVEKMMAAVTKLRA